MCGIIGIISKNKSILPLLTSGLRRLEYRGYDSSGVAFVLNDKIICTKSIGKTEKICNKLLDYSLENITVGLGHTRWATHGSITIENAHPHFTDEVTVVHNGIIENSSKIKIFLSNNDIQCTTSTDTEVIPKLLSFYLAKGMSIKSAIENLMKDLEGSFAIVAIFTQEPDMLVVAKRNSNLLIGVSEDETFVASDVYSISSFTDKLIFLEENDFAFIKKDKISIYNNKVEVVRETTKVNTINNNSASYEESLNISYNGRHFGSWMLKEIFEQPEVIKNIFNNFNREEFLQILKNYPNFSCVTIIACGSSYFAAHIAREWLEEIGVRTNIDFASEFRYRTINIVKNEIVIFISQSGETADTLAALMACKEKITNKLLAITNVENSSIARAADFVLYTHAGNEFGVAATKTFIAQLSLLKCMIDCIGNQSLSDEKSSAHIHSMINNGLIDKLSKAVNIIQGTKNILYIGRGVCYSLAQEGALKLKELSYIHAEALAAGELKHGSIALIDENIVVIALAPSNLLLNKMHSNIEEIYARGGRVIAITDSIGKEQLKGICKDIIEMPYVEKSIIPLIYSIPLQIIAYKVASLKGHDVDYPRNLAKSVTVE